MAPFALMQRYWEASSLDLRRWLRAVPMVDHEAYQTELRERAVRQKALDVIVSTALSRVLDQVASRQPSIHSHHFYGASAINPNKLATWYVFRADADLQWAVDTQFTSEIDHLTRSELLTAGYPIQGVPFVHVAFTSHEDVQRTTGGNYGLYFK